MRKRLQNERHFFVHSKKSSFIESLISSIGTLYLALVSLAIVYSYVSWSLLEHNKAIANLIALDKLLLLREVAFPALSVEQEPAQLRDLPRYFYKARERAFAPREDGEDVFMIESLNERGFTEDAIAGAYVRKNIPMRLSTGGICEPLVTNLTKGYEFTIITFRIVGAVHHVPSEEVRLVTFSGCAPGPPEEFNAIIFRSREGVVIATPKSFDDKFPGLATRSPFKPYIFPDKEKFREHLPEGVARYVNLDDDFVVNHIKAIDYLILNYANSRLGRFFAAGEFGIATEKLYEEREKDASYLGVTATSSHIVRFGPLVLFVLTFELWRRVRRLPDGRIRSDRFWFGLEGKDRIGLLYAYFGALLPLIIALLMYTLFAMSQNLGLIVFDRVVSIEGLLSWNFPEAPSVGWRSFDLFAFLLGVFMLPLQLLILSGLISKLIKVVRTNAYRG